MKNVRVTYFEPHTLKLLDRAFQASCRAASYAASNQAIRQILAQRIMSCAASGETSPELLMAFAVEGINLNPVVSCSGNVPLHRKITGDPGGQRVLLAA